MTCKFYSFFILIYETWLIQYKSNFWYFYVLGHIHNYFIDLKSMVILKGRVAVWVRGPKASGSHNSFFFSFFFFFILKKEKIEPKNNKTLVSIKNKETHDTNLFQRKRFLFCLHKHLTHVLVLKCTCKHKLWDIPQLL